ncbi:MAG: NADH:ubiquinone reductase (Na(+)-transporting) subunit A, partial [Bacteroidales bacterium]|nr:NADH:ubiquinone reductase (Na(+)-transporting) subunit A [Bacteroidales bacterium]
MSTIIKLKQGLDINLVGEAQKAVTKTVAANEVSLKPSDFACFKPHL